MFYTFNFCIPFAYRLAPILVSSKSILYLCVVLLYDHGCRGYAAAGWRQAPGRC